MAGLQHAQTELETRVCAYLLVEVHLCVCVALCSPVSELSLVSVCFHLVS